MDKISTMDKTNRRESMKNSRSGDQKQKKIMIVRERAHKHTETTLQKIHAVNLWKKSTDILQALPIISFHIPSR